MALLLNVGCSETKYIEPEQIGTNKLPAYYSITTTKSSSSGLDCVLRELSLSDSRNTFEHAINGNDWTIDIVYGKNGIVGGGQIGKIVGDGKSITFYYRPAIGNFGMDAWNVEKVVPSSLKTCA
ncbi:MAG: hypothetical protein WCO04_08465 [Pseudomonadota bacterium]